MVGSQTRAEEDRVEHETARALEICTVEWIKSEEYDLAVALAFYCCVGGVGDTLSGFRPEEATHAYFRGVL